jgi:hypothetical protein
MKDFKKLSPKYKKLPTKNDLRRRRSCEKNKLLSVVNGWNPADYIGVDELRGLILEKPPFGSENHRMISTILKAMNIIG